MSSSTKGMRTIFLFDDEKNSKFPTNKIKTTKYNIVTFLPLSILFQFTNYSNIYFLLVAVILAIKQISPQDPSVAIIPFLAVIIVGVIIEAFEEVKKWLNDRNFNNSKTILVSTKSNFGEELPVKWSQLKVGNIIKIQKNEIVPADILVLKTSNENNFCYMQTTNLDGESALKPREVPVIFHGCFKDNDGCVSFQSLCGSSIEIDNPNCNIYKCNGRFIKSDSDASSSKSFIQIENILLRGTTLKNVDFSYGIILYTGKDTKIMKNIQSTSLKSSSIEGIINSIIIGIIIFVFVLCIVCSAIGLGHAKRNTPEEGNLKLDYLFHFKKSSFNYTLEFFKLFGAYFILTNNIIPISMAITFTIAKVIQIIMIEFDKELKKDKGDQLKVLSTRLQEDLGKVKYIFTDKTGTLTRNEMMFKGCSIFGNLFFEEEDGTPAKDKIQAYLKGDDQTTIDSSEIASLKEAILEFGLNIALNHNVLLEYDEEKKTYDYQGPNPDEVSLVTMAKEIGIEFKERVGNQVTVNISIGEKGAQKSFSILEIFKYTSERKYSGIIIKDDSSSKITLYIKGADDKIFSMLSEESKNNLLEAAKSHLDMFAKRGLRTLCYGCKRLSESEYQKFSSEYKEAKDQAMGDEFSKLVEEKIAQIEKDIILLGVTGLEDRLQDEAKEDILMFKEAGIKIWMITGDQMDTAESIGYSCNFFDDDTQVYKIKPDNIQKEIEDIIHDVEMTEKTLKEYKFFKQGKRRKDNLIVLNDNGTNVELIGNENYKSGEFNEIDDYDIIKFMYETGYLGTTQKIEKDELKTINDNYQNSQGEEISTFIQYIKGDYNRPTISEIKAKSPQELSEYYHEKLNELNSHKSWMEKLTRIFTCNFSRKESEEELDNSLLNFGLVIEGNAIIKCILDEELSKKFLSLVSKSTSVVCCRCTPLQKSKIVQFIQSRTKKVVLAIGDGGNDVNMIKKASIGIGIFGKEGHQAAYNADYSISQFKYLKRLLFYHGRYILYGNSYFIYFFFYKGLLFCLPEIWFSFVSGFSGSNFWDFVWFTMYTGLVSTMPPVVIMVFEEDIDLSSLPKEMKSFLPLIYKEYRDSSPFNTTKFFTCFTLGIAHSALFYVWGMYAFSYAIVDESGRQTGFWDFSNMCMLTVLIIQYLVLFIDTRKYYIWVYLCHFIQILVNLLFGFIYALGGSDELGAYTFDTLGNWRFWLTLICCIQICAIPFYVSRFFELVFSDTISNNIRNNNYEEDLLRRKYEKKIEKINKCIRSVELFKKVYGKKKEEKSTLGFAEKKMSEIVEQYKSRRGIN